MPTSLTSKTAADMFVSSGGTNGTRVSPLGFIEPAVAPRVDYDPVTKAGKGLLVELGRTNLLRYTARMEQWGGTGGTSVRVTPNAAVAPNGHMDATALILGSTSVYGNGNISQVVSKAATVATYAASVYLKPANGGLRELAP